MNEKASRAILSIQALFLCLPLTLLYIFAGLPSSLYFLGDGLFEPTYITIISDLVILVGIVTAWWLMGIFILKGHKRLTETSVIWWFMSGTIVLMAIVANIYVMTVESYGPSSLLQFGWGILFLPPYLHLLLERRRKTALTNR